MNTLTLYDVAIVGGGMVGATLAVALAREGMHIALIEREAFSSQLAPTFDGRVSAIALGSKRVLAAIGVWKGMEPYAQAIHDIRVTDGESPFFLDYHHEEIGTEPFGWIVENRYIRHALHEALATHANIHMVAPAKVLSMQVDGACATLAFEGRQDIAARLVVGADGKYSAMRAMAGIETVESRYGQTAIVCTIAHSESHAGLAQERFLPAGPFAALPMQQNRSSLVWVEPDERIPAYINLPKAELASEIKKRIGDYLGEITVAGEVFTYPLSLMLAKRYISSRFALIGDAAHAIHPIAGQGVNLGFRDVAVLHALVTERFKLGLDIASEDVLSHYQRWRRFDNVTMAVVTDGLNRLFTSTHAPLKLARGLGLWSISKLPPLRRFFMRHAMGTVGDLPVLMRH